MFLGGPGREAFILVIRKKKKERKKLFKMNKMTAFIVSFTWKGKVL